MVRKDKNKEVEYHRKWRKANPDKVRAQIKATYDVGLTSWMLWSAANKYTKEALLLE